MIDDACTLGEVTRTAAARARSLTADRVITTVESGLDDEGDTMSDRADHAERPIAAVNVPMNTGPGMGASFGVAAPIGAVKAKDRLRAGRTALHRDGAGHVTLTTELPGSVSLQRRAADGSWETVQRRATWRRARTGFDLPGDASPETHRVVFTPRNGNIPAWVSEPIDA